jgi:hypothetical protein
MAYLKSENHGDALTLNGFRLELNGKPIETIYKVGGLSQTTGEIEWVDGQTGIAEVFTDQKINSGPLTLAYRVDPTNTEFSQMDQLVQASQRNGTRFNFVIVKYNHGIEVFRIPVYAAVFKGKTLPELNKNESGPFDVELEVPCAYWEILR